MTREKIDTLLADYKVNSARAQYLSVRIKELTGIKDDYRGHCVDYLTSTTPAYSLTSGSGGPVGSKVERLAILLADGDTPPELLEIETELANANAELNRLQIATSCVTVWLDGLQARERFVLVSHLIDGQTWAEVIDGFGQRFGVIYSRNGLKALLARAQDKIYKIAA